MTITYPLTIPSVLKPSSAEFGGTDSIGMSQSPFNYSQEIQDWGGDRWTAKLSWAMVAGRTNGAQFTAFLTALRGRYATVLLGDPLGATPRGTMPGTPVVNGIYAAGTRYLILRGLQPSVTTWIYAGDYLQVGSGAGTRLHMALADAGTTVGGQAYIEIWPCLRALVPDGTPVVTRNCMGTFRLAANERKWTEEKYFRYGISLDFIEAI